MWQNLHARAPSEAPPALAERSYDPKRKKMVLERLLPGAPSTVWKIIAMEGMERFAYYGFRAILTLFFVRRLGMAESTAVSCFAFTSALAYASPLLGAWLADERWGRFATIAALGAVYCCGMAVLVAAAAATSTAGALGALALVGLGTGGIKPCVSSFGADQISTADDGDDDAVRGYFSVFYASINVGSVLSFVVTPVVRSSFGYAAAFSVPAALLALALVVFASARKDYVVVPPKADGSVLGALTRALSSAPSDDPDVAALRSSFSVLAMLPVFWMLYDQQGSVWVVQASEMGTFGGRIQPEQLGVANPVLILVLLPLFERSLYPALAAARVPIRPPHRMVAGMVVAALSFVVAAGVDLALQRGHELNILWQLPQIFLITVAEILVSITGLEFSYTQAPRELRASVSAIFLLTTSVGDVMGGVLYAAAGERISRPTILGLCAAAMLANALAFVRVARRHFAAPGDVRLRRAESDNLEMLPTVNALLGDDEEAAGA